MDNSYSYPTFSFKGFIKQRYLLFVLSVIFLFLDMLTTYLMLTGNYNIIEQIAWTKWIVSNYGWNGVILRFVISSIVFLYIIKYQPNWMFKYTRYFIFLLLLVYSIFTFINNLLLMWR